jgi:hypothetical protein
MRLKVSVLANGSLLLDGTPGTLDQLDGALQRIKEVKGQVWYYRQTAGGQPPAEALSVFKRIAAVKVPISLSSKPDFSDWVDTKGVSHPRNQGNAGEAAAPDVRMPDVAPRSDIEQVFAAVRRTAAGTGAGDGLVIVKPDRTHLVMPRLAESDSLKAMAESMDKMVPASRQRNIAAIGYTVFASPADGPPGLVEVSQAIPFLGMLVGFSYIGHAVWVFEGHASALAAGCRDADILIVDSAMRPLLAQGWDAQAAAVMRNANILIHNRANFALSAVRKVGTDASHIEFSD